MRYFSAALTLFAVSVICLVEAGSAFVPKKEDMPKYINILKSSANPKERATAAEMIGRRGQINIKDVADAVDLLKTMAEKDKDNGARKAAVVALGSISPDATTTVPLLTGILKEKNYELRMAAVSSLANYGNDAKSAVPALKELQKELNDKKNAKTIGMAIQAIQGKKK